jgi:hypothetical protein
MVSGLGPTLLAPGILRYQLLFNELIEPVQVNIRQHGGSDPTLRSTGQRRIPPPVLQIPGLEHPIDQLQEPAIVDLHRQRRDHDRVIKTPEIVGEIPFDEPVRPRPDRRHLIQRGVAASTRTESVGPVGEPAVVVRIKEHTNHLGDQLIRPRRHPQRTFLPILLRDINAPGR